MPPFEKTIAKLLTKGWIEELPEEQVNGTQKYNVTPAGESALKIKIPLSR
jgi:chromosome segregation and condensation protein ScpB